MRLSVVVVFHDMAREAPRTLHSLSPAYQRDLVTADYEVIAIDNGSTRPLDAAMVASMKPGSVIVDLAIETGGNCELSEAGTIVDSGGVNIVAHANPASRLPVDASALYARNLYNFLAPMIDAEAGKLAVEGKDSVVQDGDIMHFRFNV